MSNIVNEDGSDCIDELQDSLTNAMGHVRGILRELIEIGSCDYTSMTQLSVVLNLLDDIEITE